jgi:cytochrome bd-type quinol oxidase subunit 1
VKKTPLIRIGLVIAFLPIALAFITSLISRTSMFDEGSGSGTYLWLLIISVPIGLLLILIGLIVTLLKRGKPKSGM